MNTSSFLASLRANPALPLVFRAGRQLISPGYHLTEVKRVSYETMDCGAMTHRWAETHFEIWAPPLSGILPARGHMPAEKFLAIIDRVERELPLNGDTAARIHASFGDQPAALYDVASVTVSEGELWIELTADRTRCKAAERRVGQLTGGCCGSEAAAQNTSSAEPATACCGGDATATTKSTQSACCV